MDNIIKKIVLDLGKKQVELTPEQAKKLKAALDEMFGEKIVKEIHHHDHYPYWPYWYWDTSKITWDTTSGIIDTGPYRITNTGATVNYSNNIMTLKVA